MVNIRKDRSVFTFFLVKNQIKLIFYEGYRNVIGEYYNAQNQLSEIMIDEIFHVLKWHK